MLCILNLDCEFCDVAWWCRLLALPRPSLKLFKYCIELETNLASLGDNSALANARKLYDSAIDYYPQEREVWRNYYNLELKVRSCVAIDIFFFRKTLALCFQRWYYIHIVTRWEHRKLQMLFTGVLVRCSVTPLPWPHPVASSMRPVLTCNTIFDWICLFPVSIFGSAIKLMQQNFGLSLIAVFGFHRGPENRWMKTCTIARCSCLDAYAHKKGTLAVLKILARLWLLGLFMRGTELF